MSAYDSQTATTLINKLRKDVDSLTLKVAVLTDSKTSGTSGGTGVATTWTTRELNTIAIDPQGLILQLESNTFKLAAGSYQIRAIAAFQHTGHSRMRLYDVTNSVVIGYNVSIDVSNQSNVYPALNITVNPHKETSIGWSTTSAPAVLITWACLQASQASTRPTASARSRGSTPA